MEPIDFLRSVWGGQQGYVFLPQKGKRWMEGQAFSWPLDVDLIIKRLDRGERNGRDQYYCPNVFSEPERNEGFVKKPRWFYADLDNVDPAKIELRPQIAVESSPGRFQALWRLGRPIDPEKHKAYNRRLTYATGADRGGWDLTQVLRIPGTPNHKYPSGTMVRTAWAEQGTTTLTAASRFLGGVEANAEQLGSVNPPDLLLPSLSAADIRSEHWDRLEARSQDLLTAKDHSLAGPEGRSGVLWELECRLLERGLSAEEVFVVIKDTVWNKYSNRSSGDSWLWREVQKAVLHVGRIIEPEVLASGNNHLTRSRPRLFTYADILSSPIREPEWAIEGYWTLGSHGIIAGLPKSYKSLITSDMAVSLASSTPFMGLFPINPKAVGPVLVIQQENSLPLVRDRLIKISHSRGLQTGSASFEEGSVIVFQSPPAIPLMFYNDFGFSMTSPDDQESVEILIRKEGIKTIIFDPLYLMIGSADENKAQEMRPILTWLLRIRNLYNCSVMVVHHWGKGDKGRGGRGMGGQRLIGSQTIYAWLEAALYVEARHLDDGPIQVVIEREFRERPPTAPSIFDLALGDIGEVDYSWTPGGSVGSSNKLLESIGAAGPIGATIVWLRNETKWGQKKLRSELDEMKDKGLVYEEFRGKSKRFFLTTAAEVIDGTQ